MLSGRTIPDKGSSVTPTDITLNFAKKSKPGVPDEAVNATIDKWKLPVKK